MTTRSFYLQERPLSNLRTCPIDMADAKKKFMRNSRVSRARVSRIGTPPNQGQGKHQMPETGALN